MFSTLKKRIEKGLHPKPQRENMPYKSDTRFWGAWKVATFFGVGKAGFAPGTMGSVAGVLVMVLAAFLGQAVFGKTGGVVFLFGMLLFLLFLGIYASGIVVEGIKAEDPGEIVIDEVVGMFLTIMLSICFLWVPEHLLLGEVRELYAGHMGALFLIMFLAFRVMDIVKPWPISWVDANIKGGLGVMLDDALAGIAAAAATVALYALLIVSLWKP